MQTEPYSPQIKKAKKLNLTGIVLLILALIVVGLGFLGFLLNTNLRAAFLNNLSLQQRIDVLTVQTSTLTADIDKAKIELEKKQTDRVSRQKELDSLQTELTRTKTDLTRTQTDLETVKKDLATIRENITKATKYLEMAKTLYNPQDIPSARASVKAFGDPILTKKFEDFLKANTQVAFKEWGHYLFSTIVGLLR